MPVPTCAIRWIDSNGNDTADSNPAVAMVQTLPYSYNGHCVPESPPFPCCAKHLAIMADFPNWRVVSRMRGLTAGQLARRWLRFIEAGERNARVFTWWRAYCNGVRSPRVMRMYAISQATKRTERLAYLAAHVNPAENALT